ncbi:hypothetical protein [Brevibacillus formosus]|uniref:hypothetical protein n=1 Tax=Brevibacillus formosus TaxID=54913 RepID=UPI003F1AA4A9
MFSLVARASNDNEQYEQHQYQSKVVKSSVEQTHSLSLLCQQLVILYVRMLKDDWTIAYTGPFFTDFYTVTGKWSGD